MGVVDGLGGLDGFGIGQKLLLLSVADKAVRVLFQTFAHTMGLYGYKLPDMDLIAVAAPSYLAQHPAPRRVDDLAVHRFVQFGELRGSSTLRLRRVDSGEDVEVRLRPATAASDVSFAKELVVAGAGISVLPRVTVQHDVDEGRLINVLPAYLTPGVGLYLLYGGGRFLSPKVRAFRDFMIEAFGHAPPRRRRPPR